MNFGNGLGGGQRRAPRYTIFCLTHLCQFYVSHSSEVNKDDYIRNLLNKIFMNFIRKKFTIRILFRKYSNNYYILESELLADTFFSFYSFFNTVLTKPNMFQDLITTCDPFAIFQRPPVCERLI